MHASIQQKCTENLSWANITMFGELLVWENKMAF